MATDTITRRALEHARIRPTRPAYYEKIGGHWRPTTWKQFADQIRTAGRALIALGFPRGGKVAILGFNRPEWVIFNHAAMAAGGAGAGIYTTCSPEEVQYIVHHCEAHAVLVEDEAQYKKIKAKRAEMPLLQWIVLMKGAAAIKDPGVLSWEEFMGKGGTVWACAPCYKHRGLDDARNYEKVVVTGAGQLVEWVKAGATTLSL